MAPTVREAGDTISRPWSIPGGPLFFVIGFAATAMLVGSFFTWPEDDTGFFLLARVTLGAGALIGIYTGLAATLNRTTVTFRPDELAVTHGPIRYGDGSRVHRRTERACFRLVREFAQRDPVPFYRVVVIDQNGIPWTVFGHGIREAEARYLATRVGERWKVPVDLSAADAPIPSASEAIFGKKR